MTLSCTATRQGRARGGTLHVARGMAALRGVLLLVTAALGAGSAFTPTDQAELAAAVSAWGRDASSASARYGDVSTWDTSRVACPSGCPLGDTLERARSV